MTVQSIDLNCDLGEFETPEAHARDLELLDLITSANIACGGHAGTPDSMRHVVEAATTRGVSIGAHPSYPDRANFGRLATSMPPSEIERHVFEQVGALISIAAGLGAAVRHVKPHGALYHAVATDREIARAVAAGVARHSTSLVLVGLAGSPGLQLWRTLGHPVVGEYFADRAYQHDGSLRPRNLPGALIADSTAAARQAVHLARSHSPDSATLTPDHLTICVHSDTPGALSIARAVRAALRTAHLRVAPLGG